MSEVKIKSLVDFTQCAICLETMKSPKGLPCLHNFCLNCLIRFEQEKKLDQPGDKLPCPLCCQEFEIPKGGLEKLPNNSVIDYVINDLLNQKKSKKATGSNECQLCS